MWTSKLIHNEKVQAHEVKSEIQDGIQDLGGSITRKRLNTTQETLQYKMTYKLKAQLLKNNNMKDIRLITYLMN